MDPKEQYTGPEIIYEGDLEIQAGSPLGVPELLELDELDF